MLYPVSSLHCLVSLGFSPAFGCPGHGVLEANWYHSISDVGVQHVSGPCQWAFYFFKQSSEVSTSISSLLKEKMNVSIYVPVSKSSGWKNCPAEFLTHGCFLPVCILRKQEVRTELPACSLASLHLSLLP